MKPTDILGNIKLYNGDCMEVMKTFKDKQFDLAICDPEYGIGADKPSIKPEYVKQKNGKMLYVNSNRYKHKDWDSKPPEKVYFDELKRVSKNQIIWGVNYFDYSLTGGRIVWDKLNGESDQFGCEIAYNSLNRRTDIVRFMWQGMFQGVYCGVDIQRAFKQQGNKSLNEKRIHPTQKPVQLYKWILQNYAKEGDTILDTHFGSLSIGIACHDMKFDLTAIELDVDYYEQAKQRLIYHQRQLTLF